MDISLKDIDRSNYEAICDLDVSEAQEAYVACNMWSLVESFYNQGHTCRAIYQQGVPVGFLMWVQETSTKIAIWRFMVDRRYQHQGIGRMALSLAIKEIKRTPGLEVIEICYNPENPIAKGFYSRFGFQEVGLSKEGDDMLARIAL